MQFTPVPLTQKQQARKDELKAVQSAQLKEAFKKQQKKPEYLKMLKVRKTLPAVARQDEASTPLPETPCWLGFPV